MITETNISPSPHAGGHLGVGGVMSNMDSSVGDPSFFLHHGFIDRNWWTWQNIDPANYTYQISGYTTQTPLPSGGYEEVTLDYVLSSLGVFLTLRFMMSWTRKVDTYAMSMTTNVCTSVQLEVRLRRLPARLGYKREVMLDRCCWMRSPD
jgi:hypothetical protein